MRNAFAVLAVLAAILPSAAMVVAQTPDADERLLRALSANSRTLVLCKALGFGVDLDGAASAAQGAKQRLSQAGRLESDVRTIVQDSVDDEAARVSSLSTLAPPDANNMVAGWQRYESGMATIQPRCEALADSTLTNLYVKRVGFQLTSQPKTIFNKVAYDAAQGDAAQMYLLATLYDNGAQPDPGYKIEFLWYSKAAELKYPAAADALAASYATGRGVAQSVVDSEKWAVIAESLGAGSETLRIIEPKLTDTQKAKGQSLASVWLTKH